MATCDLTVVHDEGAKALCRFMYTKHGFDVPTRDDGGPCVNYR